MSYFLIEKVHEKIELNHNVVNTIILESQDLYKKIAFELKENIKIIFHEKICDFEKDVLIITDPINITCNDKKLLNALYKKLENYAKRNYIEKLQNIEENIFDLLEDLSLVYNIELNYNTTLDLIKIFNSVSLSFNESNDLAYIERIIHFIKACDELFKYKIYILYGLTNLLNETEIEMLNTELKYLDIKIIEFQFRNKNCKEIIAIDSDYYII